MPKTITKKTYGVLDSWPTFFIEFSDGGAMAFEYNDNSKKWQPANWGDVYTKSSVLSKAKFDQMFPGIGEPTI